MYKKPEEREEYVCPEHNENLLYGVSNTVEDLINGELTCYYCDFSYKLKNREEYKIVIQNLNNTLDRKGQIEELQDKVDNLERILSMVLKERNSG